MSGSRAVLTASAGRRLAAGILLLLLAALAWRSIFDFDFGTHVATGRWVVAHGAVPETDPFTYTVSHRPFLAYAWLFDVGVFELYRSLGAHGLTAVRWLLLMATGLLLVDVLRIRHCTALTASALGLATLFMCEVRFAIRPELVSDLLSATTLWVLERRRQGRKAPLWLLPVAQLIWINTHLYVFGWAILAIYTLDEVVRRRSLRTPLAAAAAVCVAVLFVNPYGYRAILEPFLLAVRMGGGNVYGQWIRELKSPLGFSADARLSLYLHAIWILLAVGAASFAIHVWRRRWVDAALVLVFGGLALLSIRNVVLFGVTTLPSLCVAVDDAVGALRGRFPGDRAFKRAGQIVLAGVLAVAAITTLRVVTGSYYDSGSRPTRFASEIDRVSFGLDAADWLADHDLKGNGFNSFNLGGTLLWRDPAHKVFIDSRGDVGGEELMRLYLAASHPDFWDRAQRRFGFEYAIFGHRDDGLPLVRKLWADPAWKPVYLDGTALVFVRRDGPNGQLSPVVLPDPVDDATRARSLEAIHVDPGPWARLARWLGPGAAPVNHNGLVGSFLLRMNYPARAETLLLRAALEAPNTVVVQRNLSVVYYHAGRWKEALVTLRNLNALAPDDSVAAFLDEVSRKAAGTAAAPEGPL